MSKMHRAAARGDERVIADFLTRRKDLDEPDATGRTPLSLAVAIGSLPAVRHLLAAGVRPDSVDWVGRPPLYYAALAREAEIVAALIEAGADPNRADAGGITPLMAAIGMHDVRDFGYEGFQFVLINTPVKETRTIRALLEGGADPNLADAAGRTAAHHAAEKINADVFAFLRDAGVELDACDEAGMRPEQYAAMHLWALTGDYTRPDVVAAHDRIIEMIRSR